MAAAPLDDGPSKVERFRRQARAVACPTCGAPADEQCRGSSGRLRESVHKARADWFRAAERPRFENLWPGQATIVGDADVDGHVVYAIRHREAGRYGYVGQTAHFARRVRAHLRSTERPSRKYVVRWMRHILKAGGTLEFVLLERCSGEAHSLDRETWWIATLTMEGHALTNRWREHQDRIAQARSWRAFGADPPS
jgi:hypothetical protein